MARRIVAGQRDDTTTQGDGRVVVGRDAELGSLHDALEAAKQRRRSTIFVTGEAGTGKTTLVDAFLEQANGSSPVLVGYGKVAELVHSYLGSADAKHPLASPLHSQLAGMPPVHIHVGDDEVLLDDSLRYATRAVTASIDARLDVWMGMPHGFPASVGKLKAAAQALDAVGAFVTEKLQAHASGSDTIRRRWCSSRAASASRFEGVSTGRMSGVAWSGGRDTGRALLQCLRVS